MASWSVAKKSSGLVAPLFLAETKLPDRRLSGKNEDEARLELIMLEWVSTIVLVKLGRRIFYNVEDAVVDRGCVSK